MRAAMLARRPVMATVVGRTERGPRVEVLGLYAVLSGSRHAQREGLELEVRITRMDPDEGRIVVSDRFVTRTQLPLI
jgi:ribosomal protein S1